VFSSSQFFDSALVTRQRTRTLLTRATSEPVWIRMIVVHGWFLSSFCFTGGGICTPSAKHSSFIRTCDRHIGRRVAISIVEFEQTRLTFNGLHCFSNELVSIHPSVLQRSSVPSLLLILFRPMPTEAEAIKYRYGRTNASPVNQSKQIRKIV
jgi:hypothetical protein